MGWGSRMSVSQLIQNRLVTRHAHAMLLAGALALAAGCGKTSAGDPQAGGGPPAVPVQVKVAQAQNVPEMTEYLSVLKSRHSANINPQVEGYITKIFVNSGDHVTAGSAPRPREPPHSTTAGAAPR